MSRIADSKQFQEDKNTLSAEDFARKYVGNIIYAPLHGDPRDCRPFEIAGFSFSGNIIGRVIPCLTYHHGWRMKGEYGELLLPASPEDTFWHIHQSYIKLYEPNDQKDMKNQTVKTAELKKLYDIACDTWKPKIAALVPNPWAEEVEVSGQMIKEMQKACTPTQILVFNNIFNACNEDKILMAEGRITGFYMWRDKPGVITDYIFIPSGGSNISRHINDPLIGHRADTVRPAERYYSTLFRYLEKSLPKSSN